MTENGQSKIKPTKRKKINSCYGVLSEFYIFGIDCP